MIEMSLLFTVLQVTGDVTLGETLSENPPGKQGHLTKQILHLRQLYQLTQLDNMQFNSPP